MRKRIKKVPKIKLPPFGGSNNTSPELPTPPFNDTPDIFNNPKGIKLTFTEKDKTLTKIREAYVNAWMTQKIIEITYQRFIHDTYDKGGLVGNALKAELSRTQNEIKLAEGMLHTINDWAKNNKD